MPKHLNFQINSTAKIIAGIYKDIDVAEEMGIGTATSVGIVSKGLAVIIKVIRR